MVPALFSRRRLLPGITLAALLAVPAWGSLAVANLNCSLLLSPATAAQFGVARATELGEAYAEKFDNLAKLIRSSGAEFVGLESVGARREVEDLAVRLSGLTGSTWHGIFIPGATRYAARNLAVVYRLRRGLEITGAGPIQDLLPDVPCHLVFTLQADGTRYAVCLADLTNLGEPDPAADAAAWQALRAWARDQSAVAVILGTFDGERRKLPGLFSINEKLGWPATELGRRGRDYIFASRAPLSGAVFAPPFGEDPSPFLRVRWTDHFLVLAAIP